MDKYYEKMYLKFMLTYTNRVCFLTIGQQLSKNISKCLHWIVTLFFIIISPFLHVLPTLNLFYSFLIPFPLLLCSTTFHSSSQPFLFTISFHICLTSLHSTLLIFFTFPSHTYVLFSAPRPPPLLLTPPTPH